MDNMLRDKIEQKIQEIASKKAETRALLDVLSGIDSSESFMHGIAVGRLYNSFYYQTRRILGRDPTHAEFEEFLGLIRDTEFDLR